MPPCGQEGVGPHSPHWCRGNTNKYFSGHLTGDWDFHQLQLLNHLLPADLAPRFVRPWGSLVTYLLVSGEGGVF